MLKQSLCVLAIAACGGGAKSGGGMPTGKPLPSSECALMAAHVADVVFTFKEPPTTTKDVVADTITKSCEQDAWSADAKKCFSEIKDEESTKPCIATLTEDQHKKVMDAMDAKMGHDHKHHDEGGTPTGAGMPPPAPPPPPAKGTTKPTKGADPCEGGE
jgi:hypothetical protein